MSDEPSEAQARLLLEELKQRTHGLDKRSRLLALARGRQSAFDWHAIGVALAFLAWLFCPWEIRYRVADLLLLVVLVLILRTYTRALDKRLDALVELLEQDGLLQDKPPASGEAKE